MKRILPSLLLILTAFFNIQSVYAQESSEPELQNLPQEDREATREARREQIQNMTEEERAAAREQVKARRESMTEGSTPFPRTVIKRLITLNHSSQLVDAYEDCESVQCSQIYPLWLYPSCDKSSGSYAPV